MSNTSKAQGASKEPVKAPTAEEQLDALRAELDQLKAAKAAAIAAAPVVKAKKTIEELEADYLAADEAASVASDAYRAEPSQENRVARSNANKAVDNAEKALNFARAEKQKQEQKEKAEALLLERTTIAEALKNAAIAGDMNEADRLVARINALLMPTVSQGVSGAKLAGSISSVPRGNSISDQVKALFDAGNSIDQVLEAGILKADGSAITRKSIADIHWHWKGGKQG